MNIPYPSRWKYDILKCLDYFRAAGVEYDERMSYALRALRVLRRYRGRIAWR